MFHIILKLYLDTRILDFYFLFFRTIDLRALARLSKNIHIKQKVEQNSK